MDVVVDPCDFDGVIVYKMGLMMMMMNSSFCQRILVTLMMISMTIDVTMSSVNHMDYRCDFV